MPDNFLCSFGVTAKKQIACNATHFYDPPGNVFLLMEGSKTGK